MNGKLTDIVTTICYGNITKRTRIDALEFYMDCMRNSEGSEHERYETIFFQLMDGKKVCSDCIDWFGR